MLSAGRAAFSDCRKVLEQYRKVEAEARRPEKAAFFTNWKMLRRRSTASSFMRRKTVPLLSEVPHRKFLDLAVVYYYQMRGNRVPDATILIHETHRELWGISAEELDARAWENTLRDLPVRTDSLMVYLKEEYGVTFPGSSLVRWRNSFTWSATAEESWVQSACAIPACWRVFRSALRQVFM